MAQANRPRNNIAEAIPSDRSEMRALIEHGAQLANEKALLEIEDPKNTRIAEINQEILDDQEKYVALKKDQLGKMASEKRIRRRYQRKLNRRIRRGFVESIKSEVSSETQVELKNLEKEVSKERKEKSTKKTETISATPEVSFEDFLKNKSSLIQAAARLRRAGLAETDLTSGQNQIRAIATAFPDYPALKDLDNADSQKAVKEAADKLKTYVESAKKLETLQIDVEKKTFTDEAGEFLGTLFDEMQKHPVQSLIAGAATVGLLYSVWNSLHHDNRRVIGRTIGGLAGVAGLGMILNMGVRAMSDDGTDLIDWLGFGKDELTTDEKSRLERIQSEFPWIENNQQGRDMSLILNADTRLVSKSFTEARNSDQSIDTAVFSRDIDISRKEANKMNGKASYTALEGFFALLAVKADPKNAKLSLEERVNAGLAHFDKTAIKKGESMDFWEYAASNVSGDEVANSIDVVKSQAYYDLKLDEKPEDEREQAVVDTFMEEFEDNYDISSWTRVDGKWPAFFEGITEKRVKEVYSEATSIEDLVAKINRLRQLTHEESQFYDSIINANVEYYEGEKFAGAGPVDAAKKAMPLPFAAFVTLFPSLVPHGPKIGSKLGDPLYIRLKDDVQRAYDSERNAPDFSADRYADTLIQIYKTTIQKAIELDKSSIDLLSGPGHFNVTLHWPGREIDPWQFTP